MFLLDTNVISEVRKRNQCDVNVAKWYKNTESSELFISVIVLGEIRRGVERLRNRDPLQAQHLERWLHCLQVDFDNRILVVDERVADEWGRMGAIRPAPVVDCLLAATAKVHQLTLVTRNVKDFSRLGTDMFNPFENSQ